MIYFCVNITLFKNNISCTTMYKKYLSFDTYIYEENCGRLLFTVNEQRNDVNVFIKVKLAIIYECDKNCLNVKRFEYLREYGSIFKLVSHVSLLLPSLVAREKRRML